MALWAPAREGQQSARPVRCPHTHTERSGLILYHQDVRTRIESKHSILRAHPSEGHGKRKGGNRTSQGTANLSGAYSRTASQHNSARKQDPRNIGGDSESEKVPVTGLGESVPVKHSHSYHSPRGSCPCLKCRQSAINRKHSSSAQRAVPVMLLAPPSPPWVSASKAADSSLCRTASRLRGQEPILNLDASHSSIHGLGQETASV
jgi:hypothetical protein